MHASLTLSRVKRGQGDCVVSSPVSFITYTRVGRNLLAFWFSHNNFYFFFFSIVSKTMRVYIIILL